ncbi:uncharacterized protein LOC135369737 [Ornithodoros turicata]|uniref:uncharacterized protein LOC135369737 n=1 Tax=Ornithodoros turicata TaxID=34597 RepID=UPI0031391BEF
MTIDLYQTSGSPPCRTVRMVAKVLGVPLNVKDLDLAGKANHKPEFVKLNPFKKVPTLVDDGFAVYESNAIVYYLINKYAPDTPLYPKCPKARAKVDSVLATITSNIQPHYFGFFRPRFYELRKPTPEELVKLEENVLRGFEHLVGDGKYAVGDSLTVADVALVVYLSTPLELKFASPEQFPKLAGYYERIKQELPGYEEINRPGLERMIKRIEQLSAKVYPLRVNNMSLDLYHMESSPPCRAVRMVAKHLNIALNLIPVNVMAGEHQKPQFKKINPQGVLPTLVDNSFILWESRPILTYLVNKFVPHSPLYPSDPQLRATVERFLHFDIGTLFSTTKETLYPVLFGGTLEAGKDKPLVEALNLLDTFLYDQRYLVGDDVTVADISILATLTLTEVLFKVADYDLSPFKNVSAYYDRLKAELPYYEEINDLGIQQFKAMRKGGK